MQCSDLSSTISGIFLLQRIFTERKRTADAEDCFAQSVVKVPKSQGVGLAVPCMR